MHSLRSLPEILVRELRSPSETLKLEGPALLLVLEGKARIHADRLSLVASPGDLVSASVGGSCELTARGESLRTVRFQATREWCSASVGTRCCEDDSPEVYVDRSRTPSARRASRIFREAASEADELGPSEHASAVARRMELLAILLEERGLPVRGTAESFSARRSRESLACAVEALRRGPLEGVSLATLADEIGLSERQVSRLFQSEYGTSFRDFMTGLRVERAKTLLLATDASIIDVAAETGWSSLGHFNSVFRRKVGTTPSAFRAYARGTDDPRSFLMLGGSTAVA